MFRRHTSLAFGLIAVTAWGAAQTALAETPVPLRARGDGQVLVQIDPTSEDPVGVQYYVIEGTSTLTGRITSEGITYFTLDGMVSGVLVVTAADGSTITSNYVGSFAPVDATTFKFTVEHTWGDGTGRLTGVTGQAIGTALLDAVTGAFPADANGLWILP